MNIYILTISEGRKHHRVVHLAKSISQAFNDAINTYGRACVSCVKPFKATA